jgi:hypothetical protein
MKLADRIRQLYIIKGKVALCFSDRPGFYIKTVEHDDLTPETAGKVMTQDEIYLYPV